MLESGGSVIYRGLLKELLEELLFLLGGYAGVRRAFSLHDFQKNSNGDCALDARIIRALIPLVNVLSRMSRG